MAVQRKLPGDVPEALAAAAHAFGVGDGGLLCLVGHQLAAAARLHLLNLGGDIAGNGLSRLFMTIVAAFAELERDRIRERITQVKRDQKARGRFLGGSRPPFGFQGPFFQRAGFGQRD